MEFSGLSPAETRDAPPDLRRGGGADARGGAECWATDTRNRDYQTKWRNAIRLIQIARVSVTGETARARRLPAVRMSTPRALSRVRETSDPPGNRGGASGLGAGPRPRNVRGQLPPQVDLGRGHPCLGPGREPNI